jgi:hypothetical protein
MADMENRSPIAPVAVPPSVVSTVYERKMAPDAPGGRGRMYFEEGIATDTDVPNDFVLGAHQGYTPAPGRPNHNANEKWPDETMRERVHVGSAAWVEAPQYLGAFSGGASTEAERTYIQVNRDGSEYRRRNAAQIND